MPRSRITVSTAVCALVLTLASCGGESAADPRTQAPLVRTALVEDAGSTARSFTGTVAARVESDLGFRVSGKVVDRLVDVGDTVRRGQPLMRLDARDLNLSADAEQEAVDAAKARLGAADERADHYEDLRDRGQVSDSQYDEVKEAERAAEAELDAARDRARIAGNASKYATLTADASGVVVATTAEPGQVVSAGQTVVHVATGGPREAVVELPETLRPEIGSTARATMFSNDASSEATLRRLAAAADPVTRTYEARFVLDGDLADAPIGSTVTLEIDDESAPTDSGLRVPIAAVTDRGDESGVWFVGGTPSTAEWRSVQVKRVDDDYAYVTGEVSRGDRVVSLGAHLIRDGQRVRIASGGSAGGEPAQ